MAKAVYDDSITSNPGSKMLKINTRTRMASALSIGALLASSIAIANDQEIAKTIESQKTENTTPSESSMSPISGQVEQAKAGSESSESTDKPVTPDHLPSVFIKAVPLSSNIDIGTDFTPGIAGLIMNIAYAANSIRQATSNKFKVFYLEDGKTLFQGRTCLYRAVEIDDVEAVSKITAGDLVNVTRVSSQWNVGLVKEGEQTQKVDASHLCYERFQKQVAK